MTGGFIYPCKDGDNDHECKHQDWVHPAQWIEIAEFTMTDKSTKYRDTIAKYTGVIDVPYPPKFIEVKNSQTVYERLKKLISKYHFAREYAKETLLDEHISNGLNDDFNIEIIPRDKVEKVMNDFLKVDIFRGSTVGDDVIENLLHDFKGQDNLDLWVVQRHIALRTYAAADLKYKKLPVRYGGKNASSCCFSAEWVTRNLKMNVCNVDQMDPDTHAAMYLRGVYVPGCEHELVEYRKVTGKDKLECRYYDSLFEADVKGFKDTHRNRTKILKRQVLDLTSSEQKRCVMVDVKFESHQKTFIGFVKEEGDVETFKEAPLTIAAALGGSSSQVSSVHYGPIIKLESDGTTKLIKTSAPKRVKNEHSSTTTSKTAPRVIVDTPPATPAAGQQMSNLEFFAGVAATAVPVVRSKTGGKRAASESTVLSACTPQMSRKRSRVDANNLKYATLCPVFF